MFLQKHLCGDADSSMDLKGVRDAPNFEERIDSQDVMKQDVEELLGIYTDRERLTTSLHTEALIYCNI